MYLYNVTLLYSSIPDSKGIASVEKEFDYYPKKNHC